MAQYCKQCNRDFVNWAAIQQHWRDSFSHESSEFCSSCSTWWPSSKSFKAHLNDPDYHNTCPYCNTDVVGDKTTLDAHITIHTTCPIQGCGKVFQPSQLEDHLRYAHLYCRKCNQTFRSQGELVGHRETSTAHF